MNAPPSLVLDPRDSAELLSQALIRRLGYVPEWSAPEKSAGWALAAVAARQMEAVIQRLNQLPERQKLAFLNLLGVDLIAARAARAPVVFTLNEQAQGGSAPAGTQVSAPPPPGASQPLMFETEQSAGIRAGKLTQVFSLWPGRDQYVDHSAAYAAGMPLRAFARDMLQNTPHHLYLSHPVLLALAGNVELSVEFELSQPSRASVDLEWEYWDGQVWRGFLQTTRECLASDADLYDSTRGLTGSGAYLLKADAAQAAKTTVDGRSGFWLRGRVTDPLPTDPDCTLPEAESVRLSSSVQQPLRGTLEVAKPASAGVVAYVMSSSPVPHAPVPLVNIPAATFSVSGHVRTKAEQPVAGAIVAMQVNAQTLKSQTTGADGSYQMPATLIGPDDTVLFRVIVGALEFTKSGDSVAPPEPVTQAASIVNLTLAIEGLAPDKAFADGTALDVSKPFYPLGQQTQPGSTFYFTNEEILGKPGAKVSMFVERTRSPQDEAEIVTGSTGEPKLDHVIAWEYWNSRTWAPLAVTSNLALSKSDLDQTEVLDFTVPVDMAPTGVNGETALWVRMRLQSGSYGFRRQVSFQTGGTGTNTYTYVIARPPVLSGLQFGYAWQFGPSAPEAVLTYNDFAYEDHTYEAVWPGTSFAPFRRVSDVRPALYLGFERKPPTDALGVYFDIAEQPAEPTGPLLAWQFWNGDEWRELPAADETGNLRRAGMLTVAGQPDDTALARFGSSLYWIRGSLKEDGPPGEPEIRGVFPNAVWATQRQSLRDVDAGASNGQASQVLSVPQTPILAGERVEVRELSGARAAVEWRVLAAELFGGNTARIADIETQLSRAATGAELLYDPLRLRRDRRNRITEVWVRWEVREHLYLSKASDRHYALDRALGHLFFGDGTQGRVPPDGAVVTFRQMVTGGGAQGNVAANTIAQLAGPLPGVASVTNPRAAEGGANGEAVSSVLRRGPQTVRHRGRAVTAGDYVTMAYEASPAVALACVLPGRNPAGLHVPGWVSLVIAPASKEPRPYPSFGMRESVRRYIETRAAADLAGVQRILVTGPDYTAVDVNAVIAPVELSEAGAVERRAREALTAFLHPLHGGPDGRGWSPGRDVHLSDVVSVLERVAGLSHVEEIELLRDRVPQGETLEIPDGSFVVAGTITLRIRMPAN